MIREHERIMELNGIVKKLTDENTRLKEEIECLNEEMSYTSSINNCLDSIAEEQQNQIEELLEKLDLIYFQKNLSRQLANLGFSLDNNKKITSQSVNEGVSKLSSKQFDDAMKVIE